MRTLQLLMAVAIWLALSGCNRAEFIRPVHTIEAADVGGTEVAVAPDAPLGASGDRSGVIRIWHLESGDMHTAWRGHKGNIKGLAFAGEDDPLLASGGWDGRIASWSLGGDLLAEAATGTPVMHLAVSWSRGLLVSGHRDGSVRLWRFPDLEPVRSWRPHRSKVRAVAIHDAGDSIASSGADERVFLWRDGRLAEELHGPGQDVRTLAFSNDGQTLYGGAWFNLHRWRLDTGAHHRFPTEHGGVINRISLSSGGEELLSISRETDSAVIALDPASGRTLRHFGYHELCGADVDISPGGRYLMSTSDDASVRIWHLP
ncbi:MAG: hypothetical protein ABW079_04995 [Sedimenticola sp.]